MINMTNPPICLWKTPIAACKAMVVDWEKYHDDQNQNQGEDWVATYQNVVKINSVLYDCRFTTQLVVNNNPGSLFQESFNVVKENPQHFSWCDGEVNGPYRLCPAQFSVCYKTFSGGVRGMPFTQGQKDMIKKTNRDNNGQKLKSDLAGFIYQPSNQNETCIVPQNPNNPQGPCVEPEFLEQTSHPKDKAEVHHVVPKKDRRGCNCGKNSVSNAAVISKQLNLYLLNFPRPQAELNMINQAGQNPYPCSSNISLSKPFRIKTHKRVKNLKK